MNYTIEQEKEFQILGVRRKFHYPECFQQIPVFWDEYYAQGNRQIACGQFGICFEPHGEKTFYYAIGNRCTVGDDGIYHICNCADREEIPQGFELMTIPAHTWLKVECKGPLPQSIQGMYPIIKRDWPSEYEPASELEIEEYGYCSSPEDTQKADYTCHIWIPVKKK